MMFYYILLREISGVIYIDQVVVRYRFGSNCTFKVNLTVVGSYHHPPTTYQSKLTSI